MNYDPHAWLARLASVEALYNQKSLPWDRKYDLIFEHAPWFRNNGPTLEYCDPDTTYEADVSALMEALRELEPEVRLLAGSPRPIKLDAGPIPPGWSKVRDDLVAAYGEIPVRVERDPGGFTILVEDDIQIFIPDQVIRALCEV